METFGVIPARGGSKGIPRKNLVDVAGRPLLAYTVDCAEEAALLDDYVVSTEDTEIAEVARGLGAPVVDRPEEFATDETRTEPVLLHAVDEIGGSDPDSVVTLEPTSPLRTPALVDRCVERFEETRPDAVMTVREDRGHFGRLDGGRFKPLAPDQPRRRQERDPLYEEVSTVYVTATDALRETGSIWGGTEPLAVTVGDEEAVDVDEPVDLAVAEALIEDRRND